MTWKEKIFSGLLVAVLVGSLVGGVFLSIWTDNAAWLILAALAFAIIMAG
jgi:hypothetical protein